MWLAKHGPLSLPFHPREVKYQVSKVDRILPDSVAKRRTEFLDEWLKG